MNEAELDEIINAYKAERHLLERFMNGVVYTFRLEPSLNQYGEPIIHTIKNRLQRR